MARRQAAGDRRRHARGPPQEHHQGPRAGAGPLSRILVTRAEPDAAATAAALEAVGFEVVVVPLIERVDASGLVEALAACPRPDVLLLTSAHAARRVAQAAPAGFAPARVAVVGPATAAGARAAGLAVDVEPTEPTGVAAVAALGDLAGLTVLHARAEDALPSTRAALDAAGAHVVDAIAYATGPAPEAAARLDAAGPVDLVLLMSPSAARVYAEARPHAPGHGAPGVVAIGPTTAAACTALGLDLRGAGGGADVVAAVRAAR